MKKTLLSTIITTALFASLLVGCNVQVTTTPDEAPSATTSMELSNITGHEYGAVLALKTTNYGEQSVQAFNATVQAAIENDEGFLSTYNDAHDIVLPEDENYSFISQTLRHSVSEVIMPQLSEPMSFPGSAMKEDMHTEADDVGEDFIFTAMYQIEYEIPDPAQITISERDALLECIPREIQELISGMGNEELRTSDIRAKLQTLLNELAQAKSTQTLVFKSIAIQGIEVHVGGQESTL